MNVHANAPCKFTRRLSGNARVIPISSKVHIWLIVRFFMKVRDPHSSLDKSDSIASLISSVRWRVCRMTSTEAILNSLFLRPRDILPQHLTCQSDVDKWIPNLFIFYRAPFEGYKRSGLNVSNLWNDTENTTTKAIPVKIPFHVNRFRSSGNCSWNKTCLWRTRKVSSISKRRF